MTMNMKLLFVCTANMDRSPTAEAVYKHDSEFEVQSAGTSKFANRPITAALVEWADAIVVMEAGHEAHIRHHYPDAAAGKQIFCLEIPDRYHRMDPRLVRLIRRQMASVVAQLRSGLVSL
jgi:predicted protein tyrosine phosphatase